MKTTYLESATIQKQLQQLPSTCINKLSAISARLYRLYPKKTQSWNPLESSKWIGILEVGYLGYLRPETPFPPVNYEPSTEFGEAQRSAFASPAQNHML